MIHKPPKQVTRPTINRVTDVMAHIHRYSCHGMARLAEDTQLSLAALSRVIYGKRNPSFGFVARLTTTLEKHLGRRIDPRDLFAEAGNFLTSFVCQAVGCRGCLSDKFFRPSGDVSPAHKGIQKGRWVSSKYPDGYQHANTRS